MVHIPITPQAEAEPAVVRDIQHYMRPGLLQLPSLPPLSLYVHLPWCLKKCPYCDFNSHEWSATAEPGQPMPEARYLDALRADLERWLVAVRKVHGAPNCGAPPGFSVFSAGTVIVTVEGSTTGPL